MLLQFRAFVSADTILARVLWEATPGVGLGESDEPEAINTFLARNPGTSFVATDGEVLVGTILCGHDGRRGLIHHLATKRSHRRLGLGTTLLRAGLKALRAQCAANPQQVMQATGEDACHTAAEAFRRRFFSGQTGPDEYQTLADLPPIPPSFDEPADGVAPASPAEPEGTP